ncbi:hypothetical protein [Candidatus Nanohalobium constans]|uniref:Uncharacterized protein n=1 Tax=Candidatus Nanohalobium constans TaxID=2565781 RepID=A0A5Q0UFU8_9ARCH|nr:hypothetical protein [Candidatus Nanohalobium constans]QGA80502.1 hypothetical protein LC1Nh_0608 [Candidatus Nanohalobium constans]
MREPGLVLSSSDLYAAADNNDLMSKPVRLELLMLLDEKPVNTVGNIAEMLDGRTERNEANLQHKHMPKLKDAGVVEDSFLVTYSPDKTVKNHLDAYKQVLEYNEAADIDYVADVSQALSNPVRAETVLIMESSDLESIGIDQLMDNLETPEGSTEVQVRHQVVPSLEDQGIIELRDEEVYYQPTETLQDIVECERNIYGRNSSIS